jgi:hypothetical protein
MGFREVSFSSLLSFLRSENMDTYDEFACQTLGLT